MEITADDFESWRTSYVTEAIIKVLRTHASEQKLGVLARYWDERDPEALNQLQQMKDQVRARSDVIADIAEMSYDDFSSYFKSE